MVSEYDYMVVNENFERARQDLISIVRAQRLRTVAQQVRYADKLSHMGTQV